MTKFGPVTDAEIRQLRTEAFAAGDILQGHICHLALCDEHSAKDLTSGSWLNDNTPMNFEECREMENITQADARRICERVIGTAAAQRGPRETYSIHHSSGITDAGHASYAEAVATVAAEYEQCVIGHDGDLTSGGDRTLVWTSEADSINDDGARAIASIRKDTRP